MSEIESKARRRPPYSVEVEGAARAEFERHYRGQGFDLSRTEEWGNGYAHHGIEAMWIGWRDCWFNRHPIAELAESRHPSHPPETPAS